MTTTRVHDIARIELGDEAARLARDAYEELFALLGDLSAEDWRQPTVCEEWDVADMVRHLLGAAKANASMLEGGRQLLAGFRRRGEHAGSYLDAMNHVQVVDHRGLSPEQLVAELRREAPRAVRGRMRLPGPAGRIPIPLPMAGSTPEGSPARLTLGQLNAVTYTRDTWLHRTDIARATGHDLDLDADVDGRIVEDVVAEWADRHGRSFDLTLAGPAGGRFVAGTDGPEMHLDAVDYCWMLSGRAQPDADQQGRDLLTTRVLF